MRYYSPIPALTGTTHAQPPLEQLRYAIDFTRDYAESVDCRGSLDATQCVPTGSVRAQDHETVRLGIAHYWRERS